MKKEFDIHSIPKEKFKLVRDGEKSMEEKILTKHISYFRDALTRFAKNKASVVAAVIIFALLLFAIVVPILSPFTLAFRENRYNNVLPKVFNDTGFWDGTTRKTNNVLEYEKLRSMGVEDDWQDSSNLDPNTIGTGTTKNSYAVRKTFKKETSELDGKVLVTYREDSYRKVGFIYASLDYAQFLALQEYQNNTGIRVIYPMVEYAPVSGIKRLSEVDANYWFQYSAKGSATTGGESTNSVVIDYAADGHFKPNYAIYKEGSLSTYYVPYNSIRQKGDPGIEQGDVSGVSYTYARIVNSEAGAPLDQCSLKVRVNYYEYFIYQNGFEPSFVLGLNGVGKDNLVSIAYGARTSFLLAFTISVINLVLGTILGALMGYYGGWFDLIMQRLMEILAAAPFIIVITLFKMHVQQFVPAIITLVFAFILTGWMGSADRMRSQFYRFKRQEYVLAARTLGAKDRRLIFKHIMPNSMGTMVTSSILVIPNIVYSEATLTYLGIIDLEGPKTTSLGTLLSGAQGNMQYYPHSLFFVGLFIALLMISFNLFGNGLRDALNPALRGTDE